MIPPNETLLPAAVHWTSLKHARIMSNKLITSSK